MDDGKRLLADCSCLSFSSGIERGLGETGKRAPVGEGFGRISGLLWDSFFYEFLFKTISNR